jgi:hypothetical protein
MSRDIRSLNGVGLFSSFLSDFVMSFAIAVPNLGPRIKSPT